jgi:hypothetical protein
MELNEMGKVQLRSACRDAKIKGYSKMTVAQMREALAALTTILEPVVKKESPAKPERVEQNGVKMPLRGKCRDVWDWCDDWKKTTGSAPTAADAREHGQKVGWNLSNTSIELSAWKRFHGLTRKEVKAA